MADATEALTGVSGTGTLGSTTANIVVELVGVAGIGVVGRTLTQHLPAEGLGLNHPAMQLQLAGTTGTLAELRLRIPAPQMQLVGLISLSGTLALEPPIQQLQLTAVIGATGQLDLEPPRAQLSLTGGTALALRAPVPQMVFAGHTGSLAALTLRSPLATLALVGSVPYVGTLRLAPPMPTLVLTSETGKTGRLALTMKKMSLAMAGVTGTLGTLVLRVPASEIALVGLRPTDGVLELRIPLLQLQANGNSPRVPGANPAANATTLVMQIERTALTQYTNWPFNSYCAFNGVYLAASADGVFAITGDTDDGAIIAAAARLGTTDFGTSYLKRVERVYVGYRTSGRMVLRVITEETKTRDYAIVRPFNTPGLHGSHTSIGRGLEARYWQFELRNADGADFTVDMMEMKPTKLRRRVGGSNA